MNPSQRIEQLRIINHLNLDGPYLSNETKNADFSILNSMNQFILKYKEEIKNHYTFIIKYDNNIFSYLSYRIIRNVKSAKNTDLDIRILGELKYPDEKEYFKGLKPVNLSKAKRLKKVVFITGFNPICNVNCLNGFSNIFLKIYNPIEHFTPNALKSAQDFFIKSDNTIYKKDIGNATPSEEEWSKFYTYPIGLKTDKPFSAYSNILEKCDLKIPLVFYTLSGTEKDFLLYDEIRKSSKEGNIHLYIAPTDKIDFIKTNLSPYLDFRNQLNELNTLTEEDSTLIQNTISKENKIYNFTYKDYQEEHNENSNS